MSLRVRANGRILCAAKCDPLPDDVYVDDAVHAWLSGCDGLMDKVIKSLGTDEHGQEEWVFINDKRYPKDWPTSPLPYLKFGGMNHEF